MSVLEDAAQARDRRRRYIASIRPALHGLGADVTLLYRARRCARFDEDLRDGSRVDSPECNPSIWKRVHQMHCEGPIYRCTCSGSLLSEQICSPSAAAEHADLGPRLRREAGRARPHRGRPHSRTASTISIRSASDRRRSSPVALLRRVFRKTVYGGDPRPDHELIATPFTRPESPLGLSNPALERGHTANYSDLCREHTLSGRMNRR